MTGTITIKTMETNGSPIGGASIRVYETYDHQSKFVLSCYTDKNGQSVPLTMTAPSRKHSMQQDPQTCPYAPYDVYISKKDYDTEIINGIQIFPSTDSTLTIVMHPSHGKEPKTNSIDLGQHHLYDREEDSK